MDKLSDLIHRLNLLPLLIVVSVYHYYQALSLHDPLPVAAAFAVGLDLTHYTVIRRAAHTRSWQWVLTGIPTTLIVFSLQYFFYAATPAGGQALSTYQALIFASVVPLCITILAVVNEAKAIEYGQDLIAKLTAERDSLRGRLGAATTKTNRALAERDMAMTERDKALSAYDELLAERDAALVERDRLRARAVVDLSELPPPLARYVELVAEGVTPNGELTNEFGIGQSTMERFNAVILKG
jgi:hypothetical protein